MQVDLNQSHMMSEYLQRYVLVGEPHMAGKAIKILRLAAFAPTVPSGLDYNVRVYFLEDTQDALEVRVTLSQTSEVLLLGWLYMYLFLVNYKNCTPCFSDDRLNIY